MVHTYPTDGVVKLLKCGECSKYVPDMVNPEQGMGACPESKNQVLMRSWEHGEYKWHYQGKLTYPGSEACGQFKRKSPENI